MRKFSIAKYGEEKAYQEALATREKALRALSGHTFPPFDAMLSFDDQTT